MKLFKRLFNIICIIRILFIKYLIILKDYVKQLWKRADKLFHDSPANFELALDKEKQNKNSDLFDLKFRFVVDIGFETEEKYNEIKTKYLSYHGLPAMNCATIEKRKDKKNSYYLVLPEGYKIPMMDIITVEPSPTGSFIRILSGSEFKSNCHTKVNYKSLIELLCGYQAEFTCTL